MATTGRRAYECADCKTRMLFKPSELARKCKPRCRGCGGTFFNPSSEGAVEQSTEIGQARGIVANLDAVTGRENVKMRESK